MKKKLKPPSHKEAVERGKKGGIASGASRRKKKDTRELVQQILNAKVTNPDYEDILVEFSIGKDDNNYLALSIARCVQKTVAQGDITTLEKLLTLAGEDEKGTETVQIIDDI